MIRKNDSGRSIVEMLGVLAIMGMITVIGIQGYTSAVDKMNQSNLIEDVMGLVQEVRSLFAGRSSYNATNDSTEKYDISAELLDKMGYNSSNPYGGNFKVSSIGSKGLSPGFEIQIPGIGLEDCIRLTNLAWDGSYNSTISKETAQAYTSSDSEIPDCTDDEALNTLYLYYR